MRKIGIFLLIILLFVTATLMGYYYYRVTKLNKETLLGKTEELTEIQVTEENEALTSSKQASIQEEKVSPNCALIIKKYYKQCGHTLNEYSLAPKSLVNLTEKEVANYYNDFEVKGFSSKEIVVLKEIDDSCKEHYVLREKDGMIAIYTQEINEEENLYEITDISTEYLPQTDLIKLRTGIKANGREELNRALEDFE